MYSLTKISLCRAVDLLSTLVPLIYDISIHYDQQQHKTSRVTDMNVERQLGYIIQ